MFQIIIDPSKCKGCAECVTVCDDDALKMIAKTDDVMTQARKSHRYLQEHRAAQRQVHQRQPAHRHDAQGADAHLRRRRRFVRRLRRGDGAADDVRRDRARSTATSGASSRRRAATRCTPRRTRTTRTWCRGRTRCSRTPRPTPSACGCAGTRWAGRTSRCGSSAATGRCSTSASRRCRGCSPSGHEHQGVRARHAGVLEHRRAGVDGELHRPEHEDERPRQGVRRQAGAAQGDRPDRDDAPATSTWRRRRAPTSTTSTSRCSGALEFDGPAIVACYTTCQPEHGVADNMAGEQARLAVDTRAFPLLIYDPREGDTIKKRLSLQGNPNVKDDWFVNPKTKRGGDVHRLRPQRGPVRQALRQGRQPVGDAAVREAGPAGELAPAAGTGGAALICRVGQARLGGRRPARAAKVRKVCSCSSRWVGACKATLDPPYSFWGCER